MSIKSPSNANIKYDLEDPYLFSDIPKFNNVVKDKRKLKILYEINRIIALLRIIEKKRIEINTFLINKNINNILKNVKNKNNDVIKKLNIYIDDCINEYKTLYNYCKYIWKNNNTSNFNFENFTTCLNKLNDYMSDIFYSGNHKYDVIFNDINSYSAEDNKHYFLVPMSYCIKNILLIIEYLISFK
jgi:hypothetical protein